MSVDLPSASHPHEGNTEPHRTTVGGSKPLHRFIRVQPKIIGIVLLVLGSSVFILSIAMQHGPSDLYGNSFGNPKDGFWLGVIFITCGILYIITEHNPTKKMVTISLALSIIGLLGVVYWCLFGLLPKIIHSSHYRSEAHWFSHHGDNIIVSSLNWRLQYEAMLSALIVIFEFYSMAGGVILVVMASMAGAALRSSKSQAIVVMSTLPAE